VFRADTPLMNVKTLPPEANVAAPGDKGSGRRRPKQTKLSEEAKQMIVELKEDGKGKTGSRGYEVLDCIGKGKFSVVYKAEQNGKLYALKKVQIFEMMSIRAREKCLKEIRLIQSMSHPNIVKYIDSFIADNELIIVLAWAEGGDLKNLIRRVRKANKVFSERQIWNYAAQLAAGLKHMHEKRVMHRDLKPANIMLTRDNRINIGDLGLSRFFTSQTLEAFSKVGTPLYMSPEVLEGGGYGFSADVWSLGCILYELCMLKSPFKPEKGVNLYALFRKIKSGVYDPIPENERYSFNLRNMIHSLMQLNPADRLSVPEIFQIAVRNLKICTNLKRQKSKAKLLERQQSQPQQAQPSQPQSPPVSSDRTGDRDTRSESKAKSAAREVVHEGPSATSKTKSGTPADARPEESANTKGGVRPTAPVVPERPERPSAPSRTTRTDERSPEGSGVSRTPGSDKVVGGSKHSETLTAFKLPATSPPSPSPSPTPKPQPASQLQSRGGKTRSADHVHRRALMRAAAATDGGRAEGKSQPASAKRTLTPGRRVSMPPSSGAARGGFEGGTGFLLEPLSMMERIMDLLSMLDYETNFLQNHLHRRWNPDGNDGEHDANGHRSQSASIPENPDFARLDRTFFAIEDVGIHHRGCLMKAGSISQYKLRYMRGLVSWLVWMVRSANGEHAEKQWMDYTLRAEGDGEVVAEIKKLFGQLGIQASLEGLRKGYGPSVCMCLLELAEMACERSKITPPRGTKGTQPVYPTPVPPEEEGPDSDEEEPLIIFDRSDMHMGTGGVDLDSVIRNERMEEGVRKEFTKMWKREYESLKSAGRLRITRTIDNSEWSYRMNALERHASVLQEASSCRPGLESVGSRTKADLAKISKFESIIQTMHITDELKGLRSQNEKLIGEYDNHQQEVEVLTSHLADLDAKLEANKAMTTGENDRLQDTSNLDRVKEALAMLRREAKDMELRVRVLKLQLERRQLEQR